MRITKVDIPITPEPKDGLEHIKMEKLGNVILIAGKNGAGKTRILTKVFSRLTNKPNIVLIQNAKSVISSQERQIEDYTHLIHLN